MFVERMAIDYSDAFGMSHFPRRLVGCMARIRSTRH
jgi:hypothetical protein